MSKPATILGNMHVCPKIAPGPRPHVGGPVVDAGQKHVTVNGIPIAVEGGKGIMRIADNTAHGGQLVAGILSIRVD